MKVVHFFSRKVVRTVSVLYLIAMFVITYLVLRTYGAYAPEKIYVALSGYVFFALLVMKKEEDKLQMFMFYLSVIGFLLSACCHFFYWWLMLIFLFISFLLIIWSGVVEGSGQEDNKKLPC